MVSTGIEVLAAIKRLAAPADEQENYLRQLGTAPLADELALEFSDALGYQHGVLTPVALATARELDAQLTTMSGEHNASLWTLDALHTASEWNRVRELAKRALTEQDSVNVEPS